MLTLVQAQAQVYPFFNAGPKWGGWSSVRPGRFAQSNDPLQLVVYIGLCSID
jgi:hypothetical protein